MHHGLEDESEARHEGKTMVTFKRHEIEPRYLQSLAWHGDSLIDVLGGNDVFHLDGTVEEPAISRMYAYPFDSIVTCNRYAVMYAALGTKGLVVDIQGPRTLREVNRSYYHAKDYEYPITTFKIKGGHEAIVHCPEEYNALEIEVLESGERLTKREYKAEDIFHTRLATSLDGRYLVENAWVWQPWNIIAAYDLVDALDDPASLDGAGIHVPQGGLGGWEPKSVAICGHTIVSCSISDDTAFNLRDEEFEIVPAEAGIPESTDATRMEKVRLVGGADVVVTDGAGNQFQPRPALKEPPAYKILLQCYDLDREKILSSRELPEIAGRMMPVGPKHVVSFYDYPKLIEIETGKIILRWEDIDAGPEQEQPSAMMQETGEPFVAMDTARNRFAVGTRKHISAVEIIL